MHKKFLAATGALTVILALVSPGPVSASGPGNFTCRASALRVENAGQTIVEVPVANPEGDPCQDDSPAPAVNEFQAVGDTTIFVEALSAATNVEPRFSEAAANATRLRITHGANILEAEGVALSARADCVENSQGKPTAQHPVFDTDIVALTLNGQTIELTGLHQHVSIPGVGTLHILHDEQRDTRPGHKEDEVNLKTLFLDTSSVDVIVAEVVADFSGQPCAPGQTK